MVSAPNLPPGDSLPAGATDSDGLTTAEALARLREYGPNEIAASGGETRLRLIIRLLYSPLTLILLVAAVVSSALGDGASAAIIVVIVALSTGMNALQSFRSDRAVAALRAREAPQATVRRDGRWVKIPRQELAPGDVIRLARGDLVPADARVLESQDLSVEEAALTGESAAVRKEPETASTDEGDRRSRLYLGSAVESGVGTAVVMETGPRTEFGRIAGALRTAAPETEFERGIRRFSLFITQTVLLVVFLVLLARLAMGQSSFETVLFAVALAVGLTPEFLPMVITVTLGHGAVRMAREKVIVKRLAAIQNFGSIDVLWCDKTGTVTTGRMSLDLALNTSGAEDPAVLAACLPFGSPARGDLDPLDRAIRERLMELHSGGDAEQARIIAEIPFDYHRRRMSILVERQGKTLLLTKGAPENLLPLCTDLDAAARKRADDLCAELGSKGYRVLALATRTMRERRPLAPADESNLSLTGFLAFRDPPRKDAASMLHALRRDHVEIRIRTGDAESVSRRICSDVGIETRRVLLGVDVDRMKDAALGHAAERVSLFARVNPTQKRRILAALRDRGHVVGFLGDGINDAPALHEADVGISVSGGTEVAREAADIILQQRSLGVLHAGILEGRKAFGNVMKCLFMETSSNFGNMLSMAIAAIVLPFLPMRPTQVLLNNFLYDLAQVTIPTDSVDRSFIRKPRRWNESLIRRFMLIMGPLSTVFDLITFWVLLRLFPANAAAFQTGWFIESLATQTLVLLVIRTSGNPLKSRPSDALLVTTLGVAAAGVLLPYTRLGIPLGFVRLPLSYFLFLLPVTAAYLTAAEYAKRWVWREADARSGLRVSPAQ